MAGISLSSLILILLFRSFPSISLDQISLEPYSLVHPARLSSLFYLDGNCKNAASFSGSDSSRYGLIVLFSRFLCV